jgi:DNA-binding NarL/FixJ family response regulator
MRWPLWPSSSGMGRAPAHRQHDPNRRIDPTRNCFEHPGSSRAPALQAPSAFTLERRKQADRPMYRVLIVDDSEPWRRWLCSAIEANDRWLLVAEAADGASAVEQARALRPDLILLDVSLPSLNGIEAAQRILAENPASRILFLSAHCSGDIVDAALAIGARGYLVKADAGGELLTAMEAVVDGRSFTSRSVTSATLEPSRNSARPRVPEPPVET